jgi:hypothetical protein
MDSYLLSIPYSCILEERSEIFPLPLQWDRPLIWMRERRLPTEFLRRLEKIRSRPISLALRSLSFPESGASVASAEVRAANPIARRSLATY